MRELDYAPKPLVEEHVHIRELIETQEKRAADRTYHQDRIKNLEERNKDINTAPGKETKPFYCSRCKKDFVGEAIKQVEEDWSANQRIAFYKTKCWRGHWCIRLITDRLRDSYFFKSKRVAFDRGKAFEDMIQPFETNYELLYSKKSK